MHSSNKNLTNTEYERIALEGGVNFSDGHARQGLSESQMLILKNAVDEVDSYANAKQNELELEFLDSFYTFANQTFLNNRFTTFLNYSASCSIKIAAQLCRIKKLRVFLIEPCFDNIRHILETEGVEIVSIREEQLLDTAYLKRTLIQDSAIWIVQPNNPTVYCLEKKPFKELVDIVKEKKATLILDFCFRFFAKSLREWDQYKYFSETNVSFISIEDTGKTWSCADMKIGITICSHDNFKIIHQLHDELLLNVSPFQIGVITQFIKDSNIDILQNNSFREIEINRNAIRTLVDKQLLQSASKWTFNVPLELFRLPNNINATIFWSELKKNGVEILPAVNYYWTNKEEGVNLFRIPLSRPCGDFEYSVPVIEKTIHKIMNI